MPDRSALRVTLAAASPDADVVDGELDPNELREAAGRLVRELSGGPSTLDRPGLSGDRLAAFVEGLVLGDYEYSLATGERTPPRAITLAGGSDADALARGLAAARAQTWVRDLANTPSATKNPAWLAAQASAVLSPLGVTVDVHDEVWLAEHRFGGMLAVGGGSASPPRLVEATYRPRGARANTHIVLVGKGITFDTGGLNIKTGDGMTTMKTDMAGGAAVLGAVRLIAELKLPVRVTALVPAAENAVGAASYRPGDVIRHVGGRTSEIANTDAEGRIVLADALAYACARLKPTVLVDAATLTGAMKVSLGLRTAGLFATEDALAAQLLSAGERTGESLWRLPLTADYEGSLASDVADANNAPGNPGGITAALFLRHFVGNVPWAHLDIAGPARAPETDGIRTRGATGFGARLLARWVEDAI